MKTIRNGLMLLVAGAITVLPVIAQEESPAASEAPAAEDAAPISAEAAKEAEELAAEDAAVDEVLAESELIYEDERENPDFVPTRDVSADQSVDFPVDI